MATLFAKQCHLYVPVRLDDEDATRLGKLTISIGSHGYAQMFWDGRVVLLHRWVLGLTRGDGLIGDHVNGDRHDNRRANLRAVTPSESSQNVGTRSGSRGVYPTRSGRWSARVKHRGRGIYLGTFDTEEQAAAAADAKRRELFPAYTGQRPAAGNYQPDPRTHASRQITASVNAAIRAWVATQGIELPRYGRLPTEVLETYDRLVAELPQFRTA